MCDAAWPYALAGSARITIRDPRSLLQPRPCASRRVHQRILCAFGSGAVQKVVQADISRLRRSNRSERL